MRRDRRPRTRGLAATACLLALAGLLAACSAEVPRSQAQDPGAERSAAPPRALWVWKLELLKSPDRFDSLLAFAGQKRVGTLFLSTHTDWLLRQPQLYRRLLSRAHAQGIRVQALAGEPEWLLPDHRSGAMAFLEAVREYNRQSRPEERFDALHLDVEPESLPQWKAGERNAMGARYLEFLDWVGRQVQPDPLPLAVDVPVSFNRLKVGSIPLIAAIFDRADQIAVMAYQNTPEKVMEASRVEMGFGDAAGKKVWVGISADPGHLAGGLSGGPAESGLEAIAAPVEATFSRNPSFLGLAIHDYARYRRLGK
jgi:hypothetical protein